MGVRRNLRRWHIWLGWIVGIPMLLWTLSGVVMVVKPIEEVRGEELLREPPAMQLTGTPIPPRLEGLPVQSLTLEPRADGPRWVVALTDGKSRLADPRTGLLLPPLSAADASREVAARYEGEAKVKAVTRTAADDPPLDLRRPIAAWRVTMSDGTRFYVDASNGAILARRTSWWRFYDFMWGLHIMDPQTREDTHNPWIVGFGLLALATTILALIMLPLTIRKRRD